MNVMTLVGTRPEIIRLSRIIELLDQKTNHILVLSGQNPDPLLSSIFIDELGLRQPDHNLHVDVSSVGSVIAGVISGVEELITRERPDAFLVLGDTNSCLGSIIARRMGVPVFHHEAGNRCFDNRVPEEINRRIIDHTADYNLCYTDHAYRNLVAEGLPGIETIVVGSPLFEVLRHYRHLIDASTALDRLNLAQNSYLLASVHRAENVDDRKSLSRIFDALVACSEKFDQRVILSTHPRLRDRMVQLGFETARFESIEFMEPLGYFDYMKLQMNSTCVISDSGSISEEAAIAGFPAVTIRESMERPEALETGSIVLTGLNADSVVANVVAMVDRHRSGGAPLSPEWYRVDDCSRRTVDFLLSRGTK